jgi:hypothetical protein
MSKIPFAIVGSNTAVKTRDGRIVRAREYPWGVIEVDNEEHCDFVKLRQMLIRYPSLFLGWWRGWGWGWGRDGVCYCFGEICSFYWCCACFLYSWWACFVLWMFSRDSFPALFPRALFLPSLFFTLNSPVHGYPSIPRDPSIPPFRILLGTLVIVQRILLCSVVHS